MAPLCAHSFAVKLRLYPKIEMRRGKRKKKVTGVKKAKPDIRNLRKRKEQCFCRNSWVSVVEKSRRLCSMVQVQTNAECNLPRNDEVERDPGWKSDKLLCLKTYKEIKKHICLCKPALAFQVAPGPCMEEVGVRVDVVDREPGSAQDRAILPACDPVAQQVPIWEHRVCRDSHW